MIETECFNELNQFGENDTLTPDLIIQTEPVEENKGCFPFKRKV